MRCSLLFVTPYDADTRLVNLTTGRHGYGHVSIWAGHVCSEAGCSSRVSGSAEGEPGEPMVFDSGIGYGVGFRPLSVATGGAPFRELKLDATLGRWIWHRATSCSGCEYDYAGLVRSRRPTKSYTCSGLVASCLPEHIRCELPGRVSPNDLARYFNVPRWAKP
jgi:hypothetical protein